MKPFISPANLTEEAEDLLNEVFRKQHLTPTNFKHLTPTNFKIRDHGQVDDLTWYTVSCNGAVAKWIRSQDREVWHEYINREVWHEHINGKWEVTHNTFTFDIHEKLYTMLALRWS